MGNKLCFFFCRFPDMGRPLKRFSGSAGVILSLAGGIFFLVLLDNGKLQAAGTPEELFRDKKIDRVFGEKMDRTPDLIYYMRSEASQ
jgi:hypothetical protein